MAAVAGTDTVNIFVNDIALAVPKGELIVEAVKRLGLEIPIFCYHPRMKPVGMCRMCLVEVGMKQPDGSVRKMPKPQAACTLPASEGLVIYTDTEAVHTDRRGVLEFLLINHPLDCPICDRGGECPLQNNTLFYGPSTSRFTELKRHAPKAFPLSRYVTLDLERCIQCGRCVRFTEEISGDSQLAFRFRGSNMQPSTFELTDFESKFSGNVIEICPVGALTSTEYRFRARPWDLQTSPAICTNCSLHCNVWFDHRAGQFIRMNGRTNEAINEEWTCDRGKFGQNHHNAENRLTKPLIRREGRFVESTWSEAYTAIREGFAAAGAASALLAGSHLSNEAFFEFARLFREDFQSHHVVARAAAGRPLAPSSLVDLERASAILVLGTLLSDDLPIAYLRVRKAWFTHGTRVLVAADQNTDTHSFASVGLVYTPGTDVALILGLRDLLAGTGDAEAIARATGTSADRLREVVPALTGVTIVTTTAQRPELIAAAQGLADAAQGTLNVYATEGNATGAYELGWTVNDGAAILAGVAAGQTKALWLAETDPIGTIDQAETALEAVDFLVVQASQVNAAMAFASVVLPASLPAENDGTYVNAERRVQRMRPAVKAPGEAKPAWRIAAEFRSRIQPRTPIFNAGELFGEIVAATPAFAELTLADLEGEGTRLA